MNMYTLSISNSKSEKDSTSFPNAKTFDELLTFLKDPNATNFSVHHFKNNHRLGANVIKGFDLAVLDIDNPKTDSIATLKEVRDYFKNYTYIIYTSKSHQVVSKKNPLGSDRFRVILPMSERLELDREGYKTFMTNLTTRLPFSQSNDTTACSDIARFWFTNENALIYVNKARPIDSLKILEMTHTTLPLESVKTHNEDSNGEQLKACNKYLSSKVNIQNTYNFIMPFEYRGRNIKTIGSGDRNIFIHKTASKLAGNSLISFDTTQRVMLKLNSELTSPLGGVEVNNTIRNVANFNVFEDSTSHTTLPLEPVKTNEDSNGDGYLYFKDKDLGTTYEYLYDSKNARHIFFNTKDKEIEILESQAEAMSGIDNKSGKSYKSYKVLVSVDPKITEQSKHRNIITHVDRTNPVGYVDSTKRDFNIFDRTSALAVLNEPEKWAKKYQSEKMDSMFDNYFENLVPCEETRQYLLDFLLTKLTTNWYSCNIIYFDGISGSGKDTFIDIIKSISGDHAKNIDPGFIMSDFSGWIENTTLFYHMSEIGESIKPVDRKEFIGRIKRLSGSVSIDAHLKGKNKMVKVDNNFTIVLSTNDGSLRIEQNDRRILFINTPNLFTDQKGYTKHTYENLKNNPLFFATYLLKRAKVLSKNKFVEVPINSGDKQAMIDQTMTMVEKIAAYIKNSDYNALECLGADYGIYHFTKEWRFGRLRYDKVADLLKKATKGRETINKLTLTLKKLDMGVTGHSPKLEAEDRKTSYRYYKVDGLREYVGTTAQTVIPIAQVPGITVNAGGI